MPLADQVALLREYYDCSAIRSKVSSARYKALCEFETLADAPDRIARR